MAGIKFTEEQQKAIDTVDKSVLVSAAAGSGKTAVLVQRIIGMILSGLADVDQMVVVTFTNAAAAEMKLKLIKAIRKEMAASGDKSRRRALGRQLDIMYKANISTFHGFALRIIKEYFYKTDMEPGFSIIDDTRNTLLQMETMEQLFEDCFEDDHLIPGGSFRDFMDHYSEERKEDSIRDELISTYGKLRAMPDYFAWAEERAGDLGDKGSVQNSPVYGRMCESVIKRIRDAEETCQETIRFLEDSGCAAMAVKLRPDLEEIQNIREMAVSSGVDEDLLAWLKKPSFVRLTCTKKEAGEKEIYDEIKEEVKERRGIYKDELKGIPWDFAPEGLEKAFSEMYDTEKYLRYYISLLKEFEKRYSAGKKELNAVDFSDIEHMAIAILRDDEIAGELRERYKYFFIDEYQDTNYIQEALISRISRKDNVFKVGDVKQSIYRFRQAEPGIFIRTMEEYRAPENKDALSISLNSNFRSSNSTVRYINDIFREIMPGYDENAILRHGRKDDESMDLVPEVDILVRDGGDADESGDRQENLISLAGAGGGSEPGDAETEGEGEDQQSLSDVDAEARFVAKKARSIIGTPFYDGSIGKIRKATPRDIVVLLRSTKRKADSYYKAMQDEEVPAYVNDDSGYFDTIEIGIALSLLQIIENTRRDIPLISVLHSAVFGFTAQELAEIRASASEHKAVEKSKPFYLAFFWYRDQGDDLELREKCARASEKISQWQEQAVSMELEELVWHVMVDSGLYMLSGAMYGGTQKQANIRALADKALEYRQGGVGSLSSFISYLELMKNKKEIKTGQVMTAGEDDDLVRIMTIHKSKGLEFPFVIVAGLGARRQKPKLNKGVHMDAEEGIGITFSDREKGYYRPTILQQLIYEKMKEDEYQEDIRVLYVAFTRAREQLILVGTVKNEEKLEGGLAGDSTYLDILHNVLKTPHNTFYIRPADISPVEGGRSFFTSFMADHSKMASIRESQGYGEVARRLEFTYPYEKDFILPAKYSVSRLRKESLDEGKKDLLMDGAMGAGQGPEEFSSQSESEIETSEGKERPYIALKHFLEKKQVSAADKGTAYHRIMEYADFARAADEISAGSTAYIDTMAEDLVSKKAVDEDVFKALDMNRIYDFFRSDLGKRAGEASRAGLLEKEKPFTLTMEREGRSMMVQGIIDCCFREGDEMILIDYKSSRIRENADPEAEKDRIRKEYQVQLDIYKEALEAARPFPVSEMYIYLFQTGEAIQMDRTR